MLIHYFAGTTLQIFDDSRAVQQELRSTIVPMAVDTNHGFSLLAAILSLALTHRKNLGLHQDQAEVEYWRDMSIGHLRRPGVQENGSTENVFAATALLLCIRDAISDGERPFSWRLHYYGAFTVLMKRRDGTSSATNGTRRLLIKLARSLRIRSLLPTSTSLSAPGCPDKKRDIIDFEVCGFPAALAMILQDIRALRLEVFALKNIEAISGSSNMGHIWSSLRGRCLEIVCRIKIFGDGLAPRGENLSDIHQLYGYVALLQMYSGVLQLPWADSGLQKTLAGALGCLRSMSVESSAFISTMLVVPLFTIGCLVRHAEDRSLVSVSLARIAREQGKANAAAANEFLEENWNRSDAQNRAVGQSDVDDLMCESVFLAL